MKTVADVLVETLRDAEIDVVFGLPGGENVEVLEAIRRAGIRFVLVHNESSAVFMADATARLTGKTGVCLTTLGPGATNAVAGVAHTYLDRAPVMVITAQKPERLLPDYTHQVIDLNALFRPITKHSFKLRPEGARETVRLAVDLTTAGRPGPVHLQVSNEDAGEPVTEATSPIEQLMQADSRTDDLPSALELLARSHRPLIVVGLGLEPEGPYGALRDLAEATGAPVITTPKGKGSLPDDHPLAAGTIGLTSRDPAYEVLYEADCIVAAGFDVVELVKPWDVQAPLIWVAPWANEDPQLPAEAELIGPLKPLLKQLADAAFHTSSDWGTARVAAHRRRLSAERLPPAAQGSLLPQSVLNAVRHNTPRNTILVTDVGSHKILAGLQWPAYTPNSYFVSNGLSCMGFSLPAAIAASLVHPDRTVVCATGDAGMAMTLGELGLLARTNTPVIIIVFKDSALDLIRSQQRHSGNPVFGTEFVDPDFVDIAAAYRIDGYRVSSEQACADAVETAVDLARPALIEAVIDPVSYPTTPNRT